MNNDTLTWSGSQALAVMDKLKACLRNQMVVGYFENVETDALKVLLAKAEAGHALAIASTRG